MSEKKFIYTQNLSRVYCVGRQEGKALNDISLEIHTSYKRYRHSKRSNGILVMDRVS